MKINEILTEAGNSSFLGNLAKGVTKGVFKGASDLAAPGAWDKVGQITRSYKQRRDQSVSGAAVKEPPVSAQEPTARRLTVAQINKQLPPDIQVAERDPLIFIFNKQRFELDTNTNKWLNVNDKPGNERIQQALNRAADLVNDLDPPEETVTPAAMSSFDATNPIVTSTNATLAGTLTRADKRKDGRWYVGKSQVKNPASIAALEQAAQQQPAVFGSNRRT
jgi:hypothetical protein